MNMRLKGRWVGKNDIKRVHSITDTVIYISVTGVAAQYTTRRVWRMYMSAATDIVCTRE